MSDVPSGIVLIADADSARGKRVAAACSQLGLPTRVATHGAAALETALAELPSVLVVQLGLPLIDGELLAGILRTNPRTHSLRTIFLADTKAESARAGLDGQVVAPPGDADAVASLARALVRDDRATGGEHQRENDETGGVEGQLSQLSLADLLQLFHVSRKTGVVELRRPDAEWLEIGSVSLRGGEVVHATTGSSVGEKALYRLLAWERGDFAFSPTAVDVEPTLQKPTRTLLREGLRQIQERERLSASLPPMDAEVRLMIRRASLPIVIHPLTQEVLLVLEAYSQVRDVVDHCSFPDYQVLRTLRTLIDRGMVEMQREPTPGEAAAPVGFFSAARGARLREWLGVDLPGGAQTPDAKLLVISSDPTATREFARLLGELPAAQLTRSPDAEPLPPGGVGTLGRLAVDAEVGIEFVHLPADPRFAPLWPLGGHGAVGILLLLAGPVASALEAVRPAAEMLRRLPRARIFHALLLEKGAGVEPDALRENLSLFDESSLFLIPLDNAQKAEVLLREMFVRILP